MYDIRLVPGRTPGRLSSRHPIAPAFQAAIILVHKLDLPTLPTAINVTSCARCHVSACCLRPGSVSLVQLCSAGYPLLLIHTERGLLITYHLVSGSLCIAKIALCI